MKIKKEERLTGSASINQIIKGFYNDGSRLIYYLVHTTSDDFFYYLFRDGSDRFSNKIDHLSLEGEWMFTYIGLDQINARINIILINTKTDQITQNYYEKQVKQITSITLSSNSDSRFSGQISFTFSQSQQVRFNEGEQLLSYLKSQSCQMENSCYLDERYELLSGIMDKFIAPSKFTIQNNYWIDGWFKFNPNTQIQEYNNIILQIVQYDWEVLDSEGINLNPLKISLNFDKTNLSNNGIIVETISYRQAILFFDYYPLDPIRVNIFNESYLELLQSWVYFRYLQYEQIDSSGEFYLSFSDSSYFNKNMGQLNVFKYGEFFIYLGQSQSNKSSFLGQLGNFNIQSCLQTYPIAKKPCHSLCLSCTGPFENNCLSCENQKKINRLYNQNAIICDCKVGYILNYGKDQCFQFQSVMKSATFKQFQVEQSYIQPCKEGQFQHQIGELIKCYDCPQQSSSGLFCADCLENTFTWQKTMKCSYDYYQENNNNDNTYIKYLRPQNQTEFYFIQEDLLLLCLGCNLDEGSYQIVKGTTILYGKCHQNYYYKDQSCHPCQQNCETCDDESGRCNTCKIGFAIKQTTFNEQSSQFTNQFLCQECLNGFNPGEGFCQKCGDNCQICDYDIMLNRPKCRLCKYSCYFLPFDGLDCVKNTIKNCLIQYQQYITDFSSEKDQDFSYINTKTTLGFKNEFFFLTITGERITNNCALCEKNYMNGDTYCQYNDTIQSDDQLIFKDYGDLCCIQNQCKKYNFEEGGIWCQRQILGIEAGQLKQYLNSQFTSCSFADCIQCMKIYGEGLICIQCFQGNYADIVTGFCISCPSSQNCKTCQQQNRQYKYGWKWSVRAFLEYQVPRAKLVSTSEYEVICLDCLEGYMLYENKCILNCPKNCNRCSIINGENVCTFCGSNNYARLLTIYNNQCVNCPSNCQFCRERPQTDVYAINSLFNPDDASKYYYSYICLKQTKDFSITYNQVLQQYVKCQDERFCMNQIYIKLKAYCDSDQYNIDKEQLNKEDFFYENIYIDAQMPFSNIETPSFFEYLNGIQAESLIYELILMSSSNNCKISKVIATQAPKNVFSLIKTKLIINANHLTFNSQNGQIQNFTEVEISLSQFDSPFYLKLYHPNELIVRFKDISFISRQINDIQIIIMNPSTIEINNFSMQSFQQLNNPQGNMLSYEYTNTSNVRQLNVIINNLSLVNGSFKDVDFLNLKADSKIQNLLIKISNSVIESRFYNSSFIKEQSITNYGQILLKNVTFNVQVEQASLINLNGQLNLSSQVKLIGNFTSSNFIRTHKLYVFNSYIYNITLHNSTLIDNKVLKQDNQIDVHYIENLIFESVQFDTSSNFITLIDKDLKDSLLIQNVQIIYCQFMNPQYTKTQYRLIMIEGAIFQLFNSLFIKNILGLTDISIKLHMQAIINNVTVIGNNIQGLQKKLDCYEELVTISRQNGFIEMENIQFIQLTNSQFDKIMIQNQPLISISCFNNSIKQEILLKNSRFQNILLLKTEQSSQNSLFQISSAGTGNVNVMNISFFQNILNEYQQTQFSNSATTLLIEADQFNITLNNTIFNKNQIFNTSDSVLYIKAYIIILQNTTFNKSNIYDDFILGFVIWGSTTQSIQFFKEDFLEIFPILSAGANAKFVVDQLLISFCQFSQSTAQYGSGFYLTLQNQLLIQDTTFLDLKNKVDKDESYGGSIYINLIALNATIEIINSRFENSFSFYDGGAIYIDSRYTALNITLKQISVYNCYSFKGAFISGYLNKYSILQISNINIKNSQQGFKDFLSQFQELNNNQVEQFHKNSATFFIQYGSLYISDSIISNIELSGVLHLQSASQLSINELVIQNIQFGQLGLIQIYPTFNINTVTFIQNVKIINCNNVQPKKIVCQVDLISLNNNFQCQSYDNKPSSLISYPYDLQEKLDCFYFKLLDFTSSSVMIYVDMIQNSDYFYISDLIMRNNNCSYCKDGVIRIKNININNPEINNIVLKQVEFQNNICGSGCLVISQQQDINLQTRRLLQNLLYQTRFNIPFTVILEQSDFLNNSAQNGILIVSNLSLLVLDAKFIKNTGSELSGGILFLGTKNHTFQIMTSEFSDNTGNKGGAFYLGNKTISNIELLQILISSNHAKSFGQDLVSAPQEITISLDGGRTLLQIKQINKDPRVIEEIVIKPYRILGNNELQKFIILPSGQRIKDYQYYDEKAKQFIPYNLTLRIIALNNLKQQIFNLQNTYCTIQQRKIKINIDNYGPFDEFSSIQFNTSSQDYNLDEQTINFDPYLSNNFVLQLQFICSSVQIPIINSSPPYNIMGYSNNYELRMNIRTFKCQRGESYNSQLGTCNLCDASQQQYSVTIKATKCSVQDEITMISVKSTLIELRESYWRPYDDNNIVTQCFNFPINCNGGWSSGDESCTLGHIGALCEQCDLYNIRGSGSFARGVQFKCNSCSDLSLNTLQILLITLWTMLSILISVKGNVDNVDEYVNRMKGIKAGFVSVYVEKVSVLVKILTNYLQIISAIGTFQLKISPEIRSIFTFSGNPIKSTMYALDCFLVELSDIEILYFRNLWFLFMPIHYSTIIFSIYFILIQLQYLKYKITVISTTLIFIFIYVQPDIIGSFVSLLSYRNISQVLWVQGNVSYLYSTYRHARWLLLFVVPILIVFGFLIPIILYKKINQYKDKLSDIFVLRIYGYLYNEYSKGTYYWEIIKIFQKELIIIFLTFYEDNIIIKGTIVFMIIFLYDIFSKRYQPYKRVDLNKLDSQSSNVCLFSIVLGMAIHFAEKNGNLEILWLFYLFMGIFNFYFILILITLLIKGYLDKFTDQLNKFRDYINHNYPYIAVRYPMLLKYLENSKIRTQRVQQRFLKLKKYLWKIVKENRKNKRFEIHKLHSNNQILRDSSNQSILYSLSNQRYYNESIILSQDIDQEQINNSLDIQIQNNRQALYIQIQQDQPEQFKNQDEQRKQNSDLYGPQSLDFNIMPSEQDLENNKDDDEKQNLSFQK